MWKRQSILSVAFILVRSFRNPTLFLLPPNKSIERLVLRRKIVTMTELNEGMKDAYIGNKNEDDSTYISPPSWLHRIEKSIKRSREIKGGNYVQVATTDEFGKPKCRTLVFRGFLHLSEPLLGSNLAMKMITDARSEKVTQIHRQADAELVWWFSQSSEQFRISGEILLVSHSHSLSELRDARHRQWVALSDAAREQFYWPTPGDEFGGDSQMKASFAQSTGGRSAASEILSPPDSFLLMLLIPQRVKYLRLRDNLSETNVLERGDDYDTTMLMKWKVKRVNP